MKYIFFKKENLTACAPDPSKREAEKIESNQLLMHGLDPNL